jgi:hypothetical protein
MIGIDFDGDKRRMTPTPVTTIAENGCYSGWTRGRCDRSHTTANPGTRARGSIVVGNLSRLVRSQAADYACDCPKTKRSAGTVYGNAGMLARLATHMQSA